MIRRKSNLRYERAFTLIEMLAVVVLLGLISSVAVVSLVRADDAGSLQSARWGFANLNAQARLAARTEGSAIVISATDNGSRIVANSTSLPEGGWSASFDLPRATFIRFFDGQGTGSRSLDALYVDRAGRSADATIEIVRGSKESERWELCGLTGQFTRLEAEEGNR